MKVDNSYREKKVEHTKGACQIEECILEYFLARREKEGKTRTTSEGK
jgi:hypothetical protein